MLRHFTSDWVQQDHTNQEPLGHAFGVVFGLAVWYDVRFFLLFLLQVFCAQKCIQPQFGVSVELDIFFETVRQHKLNIADTDSTCDEVHTHVLIL